MQNSHGSEADDAVPLNGQANNTDQSAAAVESYSSRQFGCLWIFLILGGVTGIAGFAAALALADTYVDTNLAWCIVLICWGLATVWVQVEDKSDHLLLTYGPCRWLLCGMGKEKIRYSSIRDFEISQTCTFGFGVNCNTVKLFNTCSCCCGPNASLCGQTTVRITIQERPQGQGAVDEEDCCLERCCLNSCCGEKGRYCGKGCCFQPCCNPCNVNCCMMNTIFVSTNDPQGLMQLLKQRTGRDESEQLLI